MRLVLTLYIDLTSSKCMQSMQAAHREVPTSKTATVSIICIQNESIAVSH